MKRTDSQALKILSIILLCAAFAVGGYSLGGLHALQEASGALPRPDGADDPMLAVSLEIGKRLYNEYLWKGLYSVLFFLLAAGAWASRRNQIG